MLLKIIGSITLIVGIAMIIPWIWAEAADETDVACAFRICVPITVALGAALFLAFRSGTSSFGVRQGYIAVAACWLIASFIGAFPYYLSGAAGNFIDALFESTSGFTTTGCTGLDPEITQHSLILWKAVSNWLGGMGILVFVISLLPKLGISGQFIVRAEAPGPVYHKTTTRMTNSAKVMYLTYSSFTVIELFLLMASRKMCFYDCLVTTLANVSTGGVMIHPEGIGYYDSLFVELVISCFCILSSINFVLYYYLIRGKISTVLADIELRAFIIIILAGTALCTMSFICNDGLPFGEALREAFFQTANVSSTSGFVRNPNLFWPATGQLAIFSLMIIGGCAASTAGSLKVVRLLVMFKLVVRGCVRRIHSRSVVAVKTGGKPVSAPVVSAIAVFILTFFGLILLSTAILSLQGHDIETNITATVALLSNTGTAFGHNVAAGNFSFYCSGLKLFLSLLMITGRLELFTIIVLFTGSFWNRGKSK